MTYEEEMKLAYKNLAVAALEAQTAVLLHALKQAEPILDAASATAREDGGTMIPGARPAWDAVRAAIALERFPVSRSQNIILIGSGHLLSILAENARLRATIERSLKPAPVGPCPAGGEHDWPTKTGENYTGVCLKCGQGR